MTAPEQIMKARLARGWNREKLAVEVGVSRATIDNIEHGRRDPGISKIEKIAEVLGITGDDLAALLAPGSWTEPESTR